MSKHSGKPLSDVPEEDLYVGMPLTSARGTPGKITKIRFEPEDRYTSIDILYDNGVETLEHFVMGLHKVTVA